MWVPGSAPPSVPGCEARGLGIARSTSILPGRSMAQGRGPSESSPPSYVSARGKQRERVSMTRVYDHTSLQKRDLFRGCWSYLSGEVLSPFKSGAAGETGPWPRASDGCLLVFERSLGRVLLQLLLEGGPTSAGRVLGERPQDVSTAGVGDTELLPGGTLKSQTGPLVGAGGGPSALALCPELGCPSRLPRGLHMAPRSSRRRLARGTASEFVVRSENSCPVNLHFSGQQVPPIFVLEIPPIGKCVHFSFCAGGSAHVALRGSMGGLSCFKRVPPASQFASAPKSFCPQMKSYPSPPPTPAPREPCLVPQTPFLGKLRWPFD